MPNSSGGQQEVRQQEDEVEVGEVGEGAREVEVGEFWQQDEEQVVKRRISVTRKPGSRYTESIVSSEQVMPAKVNTMGVASEKRMLRQVAFTEKLISTSF